MVLEHAGFDVQTRVGIGPGIGVIAAQVFGHARKEYGPIADDVISPRFRRELISCYAVQVARPDTLLTCWNCLIEAIMLLQALLGMVTVAPDAEARDRLRIGIRSSVAQLFLNDGGSLNAKDLPKEACLVCSKI